MIYLYMGRGFLHIQSNQGEEVPKTNPSTSANSLTNISFSNNSISKPVSTDQQYEVFAKIMW